MQLIRTTNWANTETRLFKIYSYCLKCRHLDRVTLFNPSHYYLWPAKYNIIRRGLWKQQQLMQATVKNIAKTVIKQHLEAYDENISRDFIDVYLHSHNKSSSIESGFHGEEGRKFSESLLLIKQHSNIRDFSYEISVKNLNVLLLDLIGAGTETTSTTLLWALLFMTKYPEIQKKLHKEIDLVLGKGRQPSRDDRLRWIYKYFWPIRL